MLRFQRFGMKLINEIVLLTTTVQNPYMVWSRELSTVWVTYHADFRTWAVIRPESCTEKVTPLPQAWLRRPTDHLGVFPGPLIDGKTRKKIDLDENVGKCEIYLCLPRNGLPNRENLLMCEHSVVSCRPSISLWNHVSRPCRAEFIAGDWVKRRGFLYRNFFQKKSQTIFSKIL